MFSPFLLGVFFCFSILLGDSRDCPANFLPNPQFTGGINQDECYPEDFVYYSSTRQGFYMFLEVEKTYQKSVSQAEIEETINYKNRENQFLNSHKIKEGINKALK